MRVDCLDCRANLPDEFLYCPHCGARVGTRRKPADRRKGDRRIGLGGYDGPERRALPDRRLERERRIISY